MTFWPRPERLHRAAIPAGGVRHFFTVRQVSAHPKARPGAVEKSAALIDRLLYHCHIVNIRGNSYRMREHQEMWLSTQASEA